MSKTPGSYCILCVDDEANILSSLRRMLKMEGYEVLCAGSGAEALALLKEHTVHVVISDMQMPQMNGAEFLALARQHHASTIRLLLTGAADLNSAIDAVNEGEIFRYLTKPWNDAELLGIIRQAIDVYEQNAARESRLRHSFLTAIKAYSGLIDLRRPELMAHSRRVANLSRRMAKRMGLDETLTQEIYIAGLLHDIGKLGLLDRILETKFIELPLADAKQYKYHPEMGQKCLRIVEELERVGQMVRAHHEYFDGSGFPDGLKGEDIPLGARILAIVEAFEELIEGQYAKSPSTPENAVKVIASNRGKLFDPVVTDHFTDMIGKLLHKLG